MFMTSERTSSCRRNKDLKELEFRTLKFIQIKLSYGIYSRAAVTG
jgi:hypothetical protein